MAREGGNSGHRGSRPEADLKAQLGVPPSQKQCQEKTTSQNGGNISPFLCELILTSTGKYLKTPCLHFLWLWNKLGPT